MPRNVYSEIHLHITWHTKGNQPVLVDEISAEYDNGVLTVLVPKAAPRSHRFDIR